MGMLGVVYSNARSTSLKVLPGISEAARTRAATLNLKIPAYVGVLIWNQYLAPSKLEALPNSPRLARVTMSCYLREDVAPLLKKVAAAAKLTENAAAEALIARDLESLHLPFVILTSKSKR